MSTIRPDGVPARMPQVQVTMPDGQDHRGTLYERRQTATGWVYRIGIVLWRSLDPDRPEPGEYSAWMPADKLAPLPGTDYSAVPTTYLTPLDVPAPAPRPRTHRARPATAWRVVADRHAYDSDVRRTSVHRADCWAAEGGQVLDNEAAAREAMRQPQARGCILCGTDQSLS